MMNRKMMKQAQQLQRRMTELQEELESATVEATSGGGVVTVVVSGKMSVESIQIDREVVSPEEVEMLQDLVLAAGQRRVEQGPGDGIVQDECPHRRP